MQKLIPIVVILFSLSSCIEIQEEIHIHNDKSGSLSYRLESSQLGFIFKQIANFIDVKIEDQLKEKAQELAILLKGKDGISQVEFNMDPRNMDYEIRCNFSDTKKLNAALYEAFGYKKTLFSPSYLKASNHQVKKINFAPMLKNYLEDEGIVIPSEYLTDVIYFRSTIYLPKKVKKAKGSHVSISNNENKVSQRFRLFDVIENKVDVGIRIKY